VRFIRRDRDGAPDAAPQAVWTWWASARDQIATAIADGSVASHVGEISGHVRRLDGHLAWELAPGHAAQHALVVTPKGNPELRPKALAWLAAAPPSDVLWEYHAARQPRPLNTTVIGNVTVDLEAFRAIAGWDATRERLDVRLWNPAFADAPEAVRRQVAFLFLDGLLGEEDVERWIGSIDLLEAETGGRTPAELRDEVGRRAAGATHDVWVVGERRDRHGDRAVISANAALKRVDLPLAMHHLCVTIDRGLEELTDSPELEDLDAAEGRLVAALAAERATFVGRVTDKRARRLHFVCEHPEPAKKTAHDWALDEPRFGPRVEIRSDPYWEFRTDLSA
jgi:hypothetical protein